MANVSIQKERFGTIEGWRVTVQEKDGHWYVADTELTEYTFGDLPPNYPVPAIPIKNFY